MWNHLCSCQTEEEVSGDKDERKDTSLGTVDGNNGLYNEMEMR